MLRLEIQESPLVTMLRCSGRIVRGDGADTLLQAVKSLDTPHILIDLIGVNAIDAGGLGVLAELERWARRERRRVHLVNPARGVREALDATHLSSVLQIFPTPNTYTMGHEISLYDIRRLAVDPPSEFPTFCFPPFR